MLAEQLFQPGDKGQNITTKQTEMRLQNDQKDLKSIIDERYKQAIKDICRSLIERGYDHGN